MSTNQLGPATSSPEPQLERSETPQTPPRPDESATTTNQADTVTATTQEPHNVDGLTPEVASLKGMFPDFDPVVLQSILESVNHDQERAIDVLLGMSDPSYVSAHGHTQESHPGAAAENDTSLDEALARQLALEDEEAQRRGRSHASGQSWPRRGAGVPVGAEESFAYDQQRQGRGTGEVPYETRSSANAARQQSPPQTGYVTGSERGDFQDFQETVSRIAESGKRTFSSVVSKIKAKINEYEQSGTIPKMGSGSTSQQQQGGPPPTGTSRLPNPIYAAPVGDPYTYTTGPSPSSAIPSRGMDRHTASQVYATNAIPAQPPPPPPAATGADWEHTIAGWRGENTGTVASRTEAIKEADSVKGYDVGGNTPDRFETKANIPDFGPQTPPASSSSPPPFARSTSPRGSTDVPRPPSTQSGSPINTAKLGLLPKRPVSLLPSQPSSEIKPSKEHDGDDEEELEYLENPFEEEKKR